MNQKEKSILLTSLRLSSPFTREVFAEAIYDRASAVIIAHNHPVGDLIPGKKDKEITDKIKEAGKVLGISLLDHIIFNSNDYYSFVEHDEI